MKNFKVTEEWLQEQNACQAGLNWFLDHKFTMISSLIKALIKDAKFAWAAWLFVRVFSHRQNVLFSCFSAKLSLKYFERQYSNDKRPRLAVEAAIRWAKSPTEENRLAAELAARAAGAAAMAVESGTGSAAWAAAWAAWAAGSAAWSAVRAAESAVRAAESAAGSAVGSAVGSARTMWKRILLYGLKLYLKGVN